MHVAWLRHIGGRLKSDYSYGIGVVYNTFPMPPATKADLSKLNPLAQGVLDARDACPDVTLTDPYAPDLMPPNLRRAHQAIDRTVDRLYRRVGFTSERHRAEHLFMLYENARAPRCRDQQVEATAKIGSGIGSPHLVMSSSAKVLLPSRTPFGVVS